MKLLLLLLLLLLLTGCSASAVVLNERQFGNSKTCHLRVRRTDNNEVMLVTRFCGYLPGDTIRVEVSP